MDGYEQQSTHADILHCYYTTQLISSPIQCSASKMIIISRLQQNSRQPLHIPDYIQNNKEIKKIGTHWYSTYVAVTIEFIYNSYNIYVMYIFF